jgi:TetR/AcrR family transcriptional regulator, regulator of autoinduction and epiphytic fitness
MSDTQLSGGKVSDTEAPGAQPRIHDVDPRVERSRELVLTAALDLLGEVGYGALTVEAVAARSGVAKSTVYRHWGGKLELVADAFVELKREVFEPPPPGPLRERVMYLLERALAKQRDPKWRAAACVPALIEAAAHCEDVAAVSRMLAERGTQPLIDVLDDGKAAGELPAGVDTAVLADALVGPIALRHLFHRPPVEPDELPALVDLILPAPPA